MCISKSSASYFNQPDITTKRPPEVAQRQQKIPSPAVKTNIWQLITNFFSSLSWIWNRSKTVHSL